MNRRPVIIDEHEALDLIGDGLRVALGGFITAQHPMALIRGLARRRVKDLFLVGSLSASLEVDLLVGCGLVSRLAAAYVGAEAAAPIGPFFKHAAEEGLLELWECDEIILAASLQAAASGVPFIPVRGGLGTDLPRLNPDLKPFRDPVSQQQLLAVPALKIDVALTHASCADEFGNVQYVGNCFIDQLIQRAADITITTVEKIVPPEFIRQDPFKTAYRADYIVRAPYGAHPFSSHGFYLEDENHLQNYALAAYAATKGDESLWKNYRQDFIDGPADHLAYLEKVGLRTLFSLDEF